jgi:dolichyl-phosphate beta-glucosyltransferase
MTKSISFLIPVYNEEKRLIKAVAAIKNVVIPAGLELEKIIFVNDGSQDETLRLLNKFGSEIEKYSGYKVEVISYDTNRGKGYAIRKGMEASHSDYTLFFDADMATPLSELEKFVPYIKNGENVIVGTRKNGESTVVKHQPKLREALGKVYTLLSQAILNTWVTDFTCGFKAFSRQAKNDIFSRCKIDRWGYDSEVLFLAKELGYKINEKAVLWSDDRNTRVKLSSAMLTSFIELLRIRFYNFTGQYSIGYAKRWATKLGLLGN